MFCADQASLSDSLHCVKAAEMADFFYHLITMILLAGGFQDLGAAFACAGAAAC